MSPRSFRSLLRLWRRSARNQKRQDRLTSLHCAGPRSEDRREDYFLVTRRARAISGASNHRQTSRSLVPKMMPTNKQKMVFFVMLSIYAATSA